MDKSVLTTERLIRPRPSDSEEGGLTVGLGGRKQSSDIGGGQKREPQLAGMSSDKESRTTGSYQRAGQCEAAQ